VSGRLLEQCGLCGSERLRSVLNVGSSPATCSMVPVGQRQASESHHPLELLVCDDCTLAQLSVIVDPEEVFPPDYPYQSGNSKALHDNFEDLAQQADAFLASGDLVVDIGANDGTLLSKFDGCRTVGVEPTGQAAKINGPAYREFFTPGLAARIAKEHGKAQVITACNVLAHVENIDEVMAGINILLDHDGVLIAENHDLASVVAGQWDTVYHEHLRFYDPYSFHNLLERHGLHGAAWRQIPTHGGSFRVVASRGRKGWPPPKRVYDFDGLARSMAEQRNQIRKAATGVCGIGATARATTIINYCGLDVEDVECVCEVAGSDKIGRYIPGTRIPVVDEARLLEGQPDTMLFSWHLADVIVPKLRERGYTGRITVPLPTVETL
jgi:hypothetical protein